MKSLTLNSGGFQGVALAVLSDIQCFLGTPDLEAERDNAKLRSLIEHRGLGYLTLDLPELGKIFDQALASSALPRVLTPGFGARIPGSILPRFLGTMWIAVFDTDGRLRENPCIATIACFRQFFYCLKKARLACDPQRVTEVYDDFKKVDVGLRGPLLNWSDPTEPNNAMFNCHLTDGYYEQLGDPKELDCSYAISPFDFKRVLDVAQFCADIVSTSLGNFAADEWYPKHGAGAVADLKLGESSKYDFPSWSSRLESVFPMADVGFANYACWADATNNGEIRFDDREISSRLITVPKDMKGPRLIAAEPISNQYCQQAILSFLVNGVHTGLLSEQINFFDQDLSRSMALSASADEKFATIDLKHASDSVSCWLVERFFNRNRSLLEALMASRTASCVFPDGETMNLKKFTTMGAATTFPVQSIIFATICIAAECWLEGITDYVGCRDFMRKKSAGSRVFGDDLIVPTDAAKLVIQILNYLGFEVNTSKSFWTGKFREACGIAAYDGVNVTQTYVLEVYDESRPSTLASVRDCSNNLHLAGWWKTASVLASTVPERIRKNLPVVQAESGCPGWVSYVGYSVQGLRKRWNASLQREEVRVLDVKSKAKRISPGGNGALLQYFLEAPNPDTMVTWSHGYEQRPCLMVEARWEDLFTFS
jgi:hypothetical protein